jgi:hypothetical protein
MFKNGNGGNEKPEDQSGTTSPGPGFDVGKTHEFTREEKIKSVPTPPEKKDTGKSGGGKSDE